MDKPKCKCGKPFYSIKYYVHSDDDEYEYLHCLCRCGKSYDIRKVEYVSAFLNGDFYSVQCEPCGWKAVSMDEAIEDGKATESQSTNVSVLCTRCGKSVTCTHPHTKRVKKLNGIQETDEPNIQYILVNCPICEDTLIGAEIINGKICNIREGSDIGEDTP